MKRRAFLPLAALLPLAGCGFQLRQAPTFAFETIMVNVGNASPVGSELRRNLSAGGTLKVVSSPDQAQVIFEPVAETREKAIIALNSSGQVREFQLRLRFVFRLRTPQGKILIADAEILQHRDISFNEAAVLSKESEEQLLYRDMQSDVVQQIMRRLAAVKEI
ncbi:MAG: LPS assembly lipoprotein LptE [Burkholderiaceae bacterium]